jgi:hypothetical protein
MPDNVDQRMFTRPFYATATVAPGGSTVSLVSIALKNVNGAATGQSAFDVFLSDSAVGAGLTATTASGAVAAGASGVDLGDLTSKKYKRVQTSTAGLYILSITDSAKTAFKVCAVIDGITSVLATLSTASYGA